jgi:hypothetical protein
VVCGLANLYRMRFVCSCWSPVSLWSVVVSEVQNFSTEGQSRHMCSVVHEVPGHHGQSGVFRLFQQ